MDETDEPVVIYHLSAALFKYLDETQQQIITEALLGAATKIIGQDRVKEIEEEVWFKNHKHMYRTKEEAIEFKNKEVTTNKFNTAFGMGSNKLHEPTDSTMD